MAVLSHCFVVTVTASIRCRFSLNCLGLCRRFHLLFQKFIKNVLKKQGRERKLAKKSAQKLL